MNALTTLKSQESRTSGRPYRFVELLDLFRRVDQEADRVALNEFLGYRRVLRRGNDGRLLLLPEYVFEISREWNLHGNAVVLALFDRAYDLTIDKFFCLPVCREDEDAPTVAMPRTDCRNYYRAFLASLPVRMARTPMQVAGDLVVGWHLQRFVRRHFFLSLLEAGRYRNPFVSRYTWHLGERGTLTVWMPKYLTGAERRVWLEAHVADPDPRRRGERGRVQAIIDAELVIPRFASFSHENSESLPASDENLHSTLDGSPVALGEYLALEKALFIDRLPPSIQAMGPAAVREFVSTVVTNLGTREHTDAELAKMFGITKASFSRFAGSNPKRPETGQVPALAILWQNAARVLREVPEYREAAVRAGLLPRTPILPEDPKQDYVKESSYE